MLLKRICLPDRFDTFMSLGEGSTIEVTEVNRESLLSLSREFGHYELYASILKHSQLNFTIRKVLEFFVMTQPSFLPPSSTDSTPGNWCFGTFSDSLPEFTPSFK
jgi:hypothetical protein